MDEQRRKNAGHCTNAQDCIKLPTGKILQLVRRLPWVKFYRKWRWGLQTAVGKILQRMSVGPDPLFQPSQPSLVPI